MLLATGVELLWYVARYIKNLLPSKDAAKKRAAAMAISKLILQSLSDTRLGTLSPPTPW